MIIKAERAHARERWAFINNIYGARQEEEGRCYTLAPSAPAVCLIFIIPSTRPTASYQYGNIT